MQGQGVQRVHAHWATYPTLAALVVKQLAGIPYSFTGHAHDIFVGYGGLGRKVDEADLVITCTAHGRDILRRARLVQHHKITREELSVREHMSLVLKKLQGRKFVEFEQLFDTSRGVPVLVVTFIATLELAKETLIELTQAEAYAPIYVRLAYQPA